MLSFDDGSTTDRAFMDLVNEYELKASIHLNAGKLSSPGTDTGYLNQGELSSLFWGHEISGHSLTHPWLSQLDYTSQVAEIALDKKFLEDYVKRPVRSMSYPFGDYNQDTLDLLPKLGIEYARTAKNSLDFSLPKRFGEWTGTASTGHLFDCFHHGETPRTLRMEMVDSFLNWKQKEMALFMLWGHSWEFASGEQGKCNWAELEDLFNKLGLQTDVWYATGIAIIDYLKALTEVTFEDDGKKVINTTHRTIWVNKQGQLVELAIGEELNLILP